MTPKQARKAGWKAMDNIIKNFPKPPEGFGDDEISRQLRRNSEDFETWWARNHPWDWWGKFHGKPLAQAEILHLWQLAKAAYDRIDL